MSIETSKVSANSVRKFGSDLGWSVIDAVIVVAVGALINVILGNAFGPDGLGVFSIALSIYTTSGTIAGLGLPMSLLKYVAELRMERKIVAELASTAVLLSALLGLLVSLVLAVGRSFIARLAGAATLSPLLLALSFGFPFFLLNRLLVGFFNGLRDIRAMSLGDIARYLLVLVLAYSFVAVALDVGSTGWAVALADVLVGVGLLGLARRRFSVTLHGFFDRARQLLALGSQMSLTSILNQIGASADLLFIGFLLTERDAGIYSVGLMFVQGMFLLPLAIQRVVNPLWAEYYGRRDLDAIGKLATQVMKFSLLLMAIAAIILTFTFSLIIGALYPDRPGFLEARVSTAILLVGAAVYGALAFSTGAIFPSMDRPDISLKVSLITTAMMVVLGVILIPELGVVGAALASCVRMVFMAVVRLVIMRSLGIQVRLRPLVQVVVAMLLVWGLGLSITPYTDSMLVAVLGLLTFGVFTLGVSRVITIGEVRALWARWNRIG